MKDITLLNHINSLAGPGSTNNSNKAKIGDGDFAKSLINAIKETDQAQLESDRAIQKMNTGEAKDIHEVMINMEKADISMRLLVSMRNKILEAYKEIMRTQV